MARAIGFLTSLKSNWDGYFSGNATDGIRAKKLIFADKVSDYYTLEEREKAERQNITLTFSNILYPIAEKLVQNLSVRATDIVYDKEKKSISEKVDRALKISQYEVEKVIEELVFKGYAATLVLESEGELQIQTLTTEEEPFFDKFCRTNTFSDGNYCGYIQYMSIQSLAVKYGKKLADAVASYEVNTSTKIKIYYAWIKENNKVTHYIFSEKRLIKEQTTNLKTLPMTLVANIAFRTSEIIKVLALGNFSREHQSRYNKLLTFIHDNVKQSGSYRLLTAEDTMNERNKRDFEEGRDIISWVPQSNEQINSGAPIVLKNPPVDREAVILLEKYKQDLQTIWLTELDVATNSKYDSLDVMTEKQRQAENTGVSKLRKVWQQGLQTIGAILYSYITNTNYNLSKNEVHVNIGPDAQRFKIIQVQTAREILQYLGNTDLGLRFGLVKNILKKQGYEDNDELISMIDKEYKRMNEQAERDAESSPDQRKLFVDMEKEKMKSQTQLAIAQSQERVEVIKATSAEKVAMLNSQKPAPTKKGE